MTNLSRLAANLQAQVNDLRDDNDRLARALTHSTERLAALRARHHHHCQNDDERAELLTAERDHHRETLRRVYREVAGDEDSGTAVVTMETREPWLFEATK